MPELIFIQDGTGSLTVEGMSEADFMALAADLLPTPTEVNCGIPRRKLVPAPSVGSLRVHAIWHGSVVEGPGVRSVLQVQGCPIRCAGCYVPETHAAGTGVTMSSVDAVASLLDPFLKRDGVTVLGGEPLAQADALLPVLESLVAWGVHTVLYTGYTIERIAKHGTPAQKRCLLLADMVIDGPYVKALSDGAGEWRGSRNQRVLSKTEVRSLMGGAS